MKRLFFLFLLLFVVTSLEAAETLENQSLIIGRMKVTIMPEYDTQQVLVIYEGKFKPRDAFPAEALFILPKEVTKLTDVCSLSPGGQHFCQLYEIQKKEGWNETLVKLPYSDFFVDFQYAPFQAKAGESRNFQYDLHLVYPAELLEVHIQKPYRVEDFKISPTSDDSYEKKDFTYYKYKWEGLEKGRELKFNISYHKGDVKPSVDLKFSPMAQPELVEGKRGMALLVVGILLLAFLASRSFFRSKNPES